MAKRDFVGVHIVAFLKEMQMMLMNGSRQSKAKTIRMVALNTRKYPPAGAFLDLFDMTDQRGTVSTLIILIPPSNRR